MTTDKARLILHWGRRVAASSLLGAVLVVLVTAPVARQTNVIERLHDMALTGGSCPSLVGTTKWSGQWGFYSDNGTPNTWQATLNTDSSGTIVGVISSQGEVVATDSPVSGSVTCGDFTIYVPQYNGAATGAFNISGNSVSASGTWIAPFAGGIWLASASFLPTLTVMPSPIPGSSGPVDYAVTASGNGPTPTGSVSVSDNQGGNCTIPTLTGGQGSCSIDESASLSPYTVTASYSGDTNYGAISTTITNAASVANNGSASVTSSGISAQASGGTNSTDVVNEYQYGSNPVGPLTDGGNFFDVSLSSGNTFSQLVLQDCSIGPSVLLDWWDPTANGGLGGWDPVVGDPGPTYSPGPPACLTATLDSSSAPSLSELTGTVFATAPSRAITSSSTLTATVGESFSEPITAIGSPAPKINVKGKRPRGLRFVDNHNGTGTLSGTPSTNAGGQYKLTVEAQYGKAKAKQLLTSDLTLFVFQPPSILSKKASSTIGKSFTFTVNTSGYPAPKVTETGTLPGGISFTANNNGTATLAGTPLAGSAGTYPITITASNGIGSPASQSFTLVVKA